MTSKPPLRFYIYDDANISMRGWNDECTAAVARGGASASSKAAARVEDGEGGLCVVDEDWCADTLLLALRPPGPPGRHVALSPSPRRRRLRRRAAAHLPLPRTPLAQVGGRGACRPHRVRLRRLGAAELSAAGFG